jgi:acylphosphatase
MKRLTAYVSGNVQKVGYRGKVAQTAMALGLKGTAENMPDGRVKIIAEGDEDRLRWFEEAIAIKNTLIRVSSVEKTYSQASGDVGGFYKLVTTGETDSRLDQGIEVLKDLLVAVKEMDANLGGKMDNLGCKIDCVGNKIDCLGGKMDSMVDKQDNLITEVKDARKDLKEYMDQRFERIEVDVAEMKTALKEKGII